MFFTVKSFFLKIIQNEFGFDRKATESCFAAKRMFEILSDF